MTHLSTSKITLIGLFLAAAIGAQDEPADKPTTKPSTSKPITGSYYPLAEDATWQYRDTGGAPVGATLTWKWTEMGSVQTMGGAPQPDPETLKIHYTARIEEMQDKVKVPAGEFTAVRVKITSKGFYVVDTTWWFAKGVDPVKRLEKGRGDNPDRIFELTRFTPGIEVKETAEATARRFLRKNQSWARLDEPSQFRHMKQRFLSDHFRNQFFLVRWPKRDQTLFVRVRRGVARVFDPADIKHWRELLEDEGTQLANNAMGF
ncbi:MAG: hypothetical protein ACYST0_09940, partial [Planctomycetota bacterium]